VNDAVTGDHDGDRVGANSLTDSPCAPGAQPQLLGAGFAAVAHARLVSTNWWRTAAWTGHGLVAVAMLVLHLRATSR
jgi:hypothetical protein